MPAADKHQDALESYHQGRFDDAVDLLREALAEEETSERWNDWATAQLACGRTPESEQGYRRALQLQPNNGGAALNLGVLLASQGRPGEAVAWLERSEPAANGEQRAIVQQLLARCRGSLGTNGAPSGVDLLSREIRRAFSVQTTALNSMTLRLIAIEARLENSARNAAPPSCSPASQHRGTDVIPEVPLSAVFSTTRRVQILAPPSGPPSVTLAEMCVLLHLMVRSRAKTIFEIGTHVGRTALNFALNSAKTARIYTLDFPPERQKEFGYEAGSLLRGKPQRKQVRQLNGDSLTFDFSPYYGFADFVFIDGSHAYEHVLRDSLNALKLLRKGRGLVAWHDYGWEDVAPALNKLFLEDKKLSGMKHVKDTSLVYAEVGSKPAQGNRARPSGAGQ